MTNDNQPSLDAAETAYNRRDFQTALRHWQPLADQGNAKAQFWLGMLYECGDGVEWNFAEAAKWWRRAAEQGLVEAQFNFGMKHLIGEGMTPNYTEAYFWMSLAGKDGYKIAIKLQRDAADRLTSEEIAEVEKRVQEWKPTPAPAAATEKK